MCMSLKTPEEPVLCLGWHVLYRMAIEPEHRKLLDADQDRSKAIQSCEHDSASLLAPRQPLLVCHGLSGLKYRQWMMMRQHKVSSSCSLALLQHPAVQYRRASSP